jgi:hypothetical protein
LGRPETGSERAWRAVRSIWRGLMAGGCESGRRGSREEGGDETRKRRQS